MCLIYIWVFVSLLQILTRFDRPVLQCDSSYSPTLFLCTLFDVVACLCNSKLLCILLLQINELTSIHPTDVRAFLTDQLLESGSVSRLYAVILRCSLIALTALLLPSDLDLSGSRGFHSTVTVLEARAAVCLWYYFLK